MSPLPVLVQDDRRVGEQFRGPGVHDLLELRRFEKPVHADVWILQEDRVLGVRHVEDALEDRGPHLVSNICAIAVVDDFVRDAIDDLWLVAPEEHLAHPLLAHEDPHVVDEFARLGRQRAHDVVSDERPEVGLQLLDEVGHHAHELQQSGLEGLAPGAVVVQLAAARKHGSPSSLRDGDGPRAPSKNVPGV